MSFMGTEVVVVPERGALMNLAVTALVDIISSAADEHAFGGLKMV